MEAAGWTPIGARRDPGFQLGSLWSQDKAWPWPDKHHQDPQSTEDACGPPEEDRQGWKLQNTSWGGQVRKGARLGRQP